MVLKGKKVMLRSHRLSDAPTYVKWFNDPEVHKFIFVREMNLKEERKWIRNVKKDKFKHNFAIETKEGILIGSVGIDILSKRDSRGSFGIIIGEKEYWSKGYGTETTRLVLDYGFKKLKLNRIELGVFEYNKRAIQVYKKMGFKLEGKLRDHITWKGKFYSTLMMAILKREWKNK